jgi:glycyl-tRNA synthetase beta chain
MPPVVGNPFLLEIGTEEIPARMIRQALEDLRALLCRALEEQRLPFGDVETFGTPRRLGILIRDLAPGQEDREEIIYGPPKKQALDEAGNFTKAALGFARARGIPPEKLEFFTRDRGECVGLRAVVRGKSAVECLAEVIPGAVQSMTFPKMMRWGTGSLRFVRPIRNLLALYGPALVPMVIAGVPARRGTFGHRFLGAGRISIAEPGSYENALKDNFVLVRPGERESLIRKGLQEKAGQAGGVPFIDAELLEEVVFSTEYPVVICGRLDEKFLSLPKEILITSMKEHQNDFPVCREEKADGGDLLPFFLTVLDIPDASGEIVRGNERVLHARLSDAAFFLEEDRKVKLEARTGLLDKVLFLEKLGSYREKTQRMEKLASFLARSLKLGEEEEKLVRTACRLSKCDLTTEIVGEFPSLQGIAGGIYAREERYPEAVWRAIDEHYLPYSLDGKSPAGIFGGIVSIADKADLITGCFGLGAEPSGTKDPYGLRRAAQGICRIVLDQRLTLSLRGVFEESLRLYGEKIAVGKEPAENVLSRIQAFFENRLKFIFEKEGHRYDTVQAALKAGLDDILDAASRTAAISKMRGEENFEALITAYKRVANIIRGAEPAPFEPGLLRESAESALYKELSRERPALEKNIAERGYEEALTRIASLRPIVDRFFDEVLVMDPDEKLRRNRISLLQSISQSFSKIADFSLIVEEGPGRTGDSTHDV